MAPKASASIREYLQHFTRNKKKALVRPLTGQALYLKSDIYAKASSGKSRWYQ